MHSLPQARAIPGFLLSLLQLVAQEGVPTEVAIQAAIQFKNGVADGWREGEAYEKLWTESDKVLVRDNIVEVRREWFECWSCDCVPDKVRLCDSHLWLPVVF